ncbi:hypothetical protein N7490_002999 [Penicillium lividum]|nr:hypothetical protein N7490_002999 [Penicillium lividum]
MKLSKIFQILSLSTLAASLPDIKIKKDNAEMSYDFPSTESFVPSETSSSAYTAGIVGRAIVNNHCHFPIYLWSVGSTIGPAVTTAPNGRYIETFHHDPKSGGIAIKITTVRDGLLRNAPLTIFAYNLSGDGKVWYDLSDLFGDPFKGYRVSLQPSEPLISWNNGQPPPGSGVRVHRAANDLILTLC